MSAFLALSVFYEVAALLIMATVIGLAGLALRQPLIVAFIVVGVLAGPTVLAIAQSTAHIDLLADLGVALLLFLVGLKLDLHLIRSLGAVALATGLGQIAFTSLVGLAICLGLGMPLMSAAYVAVALTFSSTIIIVKLLSDKREIDSLHGRIALGFLIVQDIVVVLALAALSTLGMAGLQGEGPAPLLAGRLAGGAVFVGLAVAMWLIAGRFLARLAQAPELLVTFAIGWAAAMAALGDFVGFGKEMGGLVAGVALSGSPLREILAGRLASIREFLLLFFFIALGSHLDLGLISASVGEGLILSCFVLIGNPLIVMAIMGFMGYRKRTGFLAGLTVAQISEFSLVLMAMGFAVGHVGPDDIGLVTLVGLVTITASTYLIYYSHPIYARLERLLYPFERRTPWREPPATGKATKLPVDAVIFGLGRYGSAIARHLRQRGLSVMGVDFDPQIVRRSAASGLPTVFGDVTDPDFTRHLPIDAANWAICAVPGTRSGLMIGDPRLTFLQALAAAGFTGQTAVVASDEWDAADMRAAGATLVSLPFEDAAEETADLIAGIKSRRPEPEQSGRRPPANEEMAR